MSRFSVAPGRVAVAARIMLTPILVQSVEITRSTCSAVTLLTTIIFLGEPKIAVKLVATAAALKSGSHRYAPENL